MKKRKKRVKRSASKKITTKKIIKHIATKSGGAVSNIWKLYEIGDKVVDLFGRAHKIVGSKKGK